MQVPTLEGLSDPSGALDGFVLQYEYVSRHESTVLATAAPCLSSEGLWETGRMEARDLVHEVSVLSPSDDAVAALEALVSSGMPGLVVQVDDSFTTIPAAQALRVVLPEYVLDDHALGRVWDEATADELGARLAGRRVSDLLELLERDEWPQPIVAADATLVEIASVMAFAHVPLVAVLENGRLLGVVTVHDVISRLT